MEERELTVRFDDKDVIYDVTELDELSLAYANDPQSPGKRIPDRCHAIYHEPFCNAAEESSLYRCDQSEKDLRFGGREESRVLCQNKNSNSSNYSENY